MRIIQVIGRSNAGKTTFNRTLCTTLQRLGTVAALKHLGHHTFRLEEGKDSTVLFETGVKTAVGVDEEKAVLITRETGLPGLVRQLADTGIDFLVIEGFKTYAFPAVVIGELQSDHCLLRNPSVDEVIAALPRFPVLHSIGRLIGEGGPGSASALVWTPPSPPGGSGITSSEDREDILRENLKSLEFQGIRIRYQAPIEGIVPEQVLIAVTATNSTAGCRLLLKASEALDRAW